MVSAPATASSTGLSKLRARCPSLASKLRNRAPLRGPFETHDNLAEHLPTGEAGKALLEIGKCDLAIDHGAQAARHLAQAVANVAHRGAERADDAILLLEQLHEIDGRSRARGRAAGDEPSAALEAEQRAVERVGADVLEHDVDAFLGGELAHHALEAVGAIVDRVIGAKPARLVGFGIVADGGDHHAAERLGHLNGGGADAGAAGMNQDRLARLQLGVIEQHVLDGRERDRRAGGIRPGHPIRDRDNQARRKVDEIAGETVDVESLDPLHILAQVVAAFAAGAAMAASDCAVHHHGIARRQAGYVSPDRGDFSSRLRANDERKRALGKRHAAKGPHVNVVECHGADADLDLVRPRRRRRPKLAKLKFAIGDKGECAHQYPGPVRPVPGPSPG
jgi:hypothetical protein